MRLKLYKTKENHPDEMGFIDILIKFKHASGKNILRLNLRTSKFLVLLRFFQFLILPFHRIDLWY